jgi:hypothetical protein
MNTIPVTLDNGTQVLLYSSSIMKDEVGVTKKKSTPKKTFKYVPWYDDSGNMEPANILNVITENNISPEILNTKAKFIIGKGIRYYITEIKDGKEKKLLIKDAEIDQFLKRSNIFETLDNSAKDAQYFGNGFIEVIKKMNGIHSISHIDATISRAEEAEGGIIPAYFLCGNWAKPKYVEGDDNMEEGNVIRVEAFPFDEDWNYDEAYLDSIPAKSIYHFKEYTPGYPYYSLPSWYGTMKWIKLANAIPEWHLSGMTNGYAIRYIIEVNERYFARFTDQEQIQSAKAKLEEDLKTCLAGKDNAGKSIYTVMPDEQYREKGLIRITPIQTHLHDEAFTVLFDHSNTATTSGFAIDPTLCGIETQGKMSSGSEKREAYDIWLKLHANRQRAKFTKLMDAISAINGWVKRYPTLEWGFENVELTTLDVTPTGTQNVI